MEPMLIGIGVGVVVGLVVAPKQTLGLIGRSFMGTLSLIADVAALIFAW